MLQHHLPEDFVFATGKVHRVEDIAQIAFGVMQLDWRSHVKQNPRFLRYAEPLRLVGDATKAKRLLNWEPQTTFAETITEMTRAEFAALAGRD